jgi:hypothetical protein
VALFEAFVWVAVFLIADNDLSDFQFVLGYMTVLAAEILVPFLYDFEVFGFQTPVRALSAWQKGTVIVRAVGLVPVDSVGSQFPHVRITGRWDRRKACLGEAFDFKNLRRRCLHGLY